ncbi:Hypothetical predicted protein [Scomber scombrus]|uniref:Uncharacterized protein n=1 Tax=Scomber scombrus TaxID=13677 RepID=A0AAV1NVT9_SCOSC
MGKQKTTFIFIDRMNINTSVFVLHHEGKSTFQTKQPIRQRGVGGCWGTRCSSSASLGAAT